MTTAPSPPIIPLASPPPAPDPYHRPALELADLLAILGDALAFFPPLYVNSILGHPWTWPPPHSKTSEFSIVNPRQVARSLGYLVDVTVPAVPAQLPEFLPGIGDAVFWRPTTVHYQLDPNDDPYSYPEEAWIFINGIATNWPLAEINSELLASMFRRPMTVIQNATDSLAIDLVECVIGKAWHVMSEPSAKAYPFIRHALEHADKQRVVVICHSQGTIIMSNVLRALVNDAYRQELSASASRFQRRPGGVVLEPLTDPGSLHKLEIYAFANCASVMAYAPGLVSERRNPVPWIENFGNQYDLIARCGMLAPKKEKRGIVIDGGSYVRRGMWGHVLNAHYLRGIDEHLKDPGRHPDPYVSDTGGGRPRLYDYFGGAVPEPY